MKIDQRVRELVYEALDEVNESLPEERQLAKAEGTVLFGENGNLDSLGLVNLIVSVEERIEESYGQTLRLVDERAMSMKKSPFATVDSLSQYVQFLLKENAPG